MKKTLLLLVSCAFFLSACKLDEGTTINPETNVDEKITVATNLDNTLILNLINDKRKSGCTCGTTVMPSVPALTWNNLLALAASDHSKDMDKNNFFSHESSQSKASPTQRTTAAGYNWKLLAENIASGQINEQAVVNAWFTSEGHCKNIMTAGFKEMGVAKEGIYWTQLLATKRD